MKVTLKYIIPDAREGLTENERERANGALSKVTRWNIDVLLIQMWLAVHRIDDF